MANLKFLINWMDAKTVFTSFAILISYLITTAQTFSVLSDLSASSQYKMVELTDTGYLVYAATQDTINIETFRNISSIEYDFFGDTISYKKFSFSPNYSYFIVDVNTRIHDNTLVFAIEELNTATDTLYCKLIWTDNFGDTIQTRQYASPYYYESNDPSNSSWWMRPTSIAISDDGAYIYLVCRVIDYPPIQNSFILMKLTNTGELIWTYNQPFDDNYYACNAVVFHDGNPWVGITGDGGGTYYNLLIELNELNGEVLQEIELNPGELPPGRTVTDMLSLEDGVVVSCFQLGQGSEVTPAIYKMDYSGNYIWYCEIPNGYNIEQYNDHLVQAQDGGFVCAAVHYQGGATPGIPGVNNYVYRTWLWKVDADGNFLWDRKYEYLSLDSAYFNVYAYPHDLKATPDGGFIVAGEATATCSNYPTCDAFIQQGWLLKVDGCGCLVPGCDESCIISSPELHTEQNAPYFLYGPNPIGDALHIYLKTSTKVDLAQSQLLLFDHLGRCIHQLSLAHDDTTYVIDTTSLAVGDYIITLTKEGQMLQTEKLVKR
jgi:hypothetical protein